MITKDSILKDIKKILLLAIILMISNAKFS